MMKTSYDIQCHTGRNIERPIRQLHLHGMNLKISLTPTLQQTRPLASSKIFRSNANRMSLVLNAKRTQQTIATTTDVTTNLVRGQIILAQMIVVKILMEKLFHNNSYNQRPRDCNHRNQGRGRGQDR